MFQQNNADTDKTISLNIVEPYDFDLSLRSIRSFQPSLPDTDDRLHLAARIGELPVLIEVFRSPESTGKLQACSTPEADNRRLRSMVEWVLFAELDLSPFYRLVSINPELEATIKKLHGLKPVRPVSLFEMAVIAITEQQISLAAAYKIRSRILQRFGHPVDNQWIFPEPQTLSDATLEDLRSCGLSRQKSRYIHDLSLKVADGTLDLDILKDMDDDDAKEMIMSLKGFGRWSADYILVRGLARPDCVPVDDLGIQSVVGEYLGDGRRVSADEVARKLEPFRPYRGLLAFYLLAAHRLSLSGD